MFKRIVSIAIVCLLLAAIAPWSGAAQWKAPADKPGKAKVVTLVAPSLEFDEVGWFTEGFADVMKDGKCGIVDQKGKVIVPLKYDKAEILSEKFMGVVKDGKVGVIDISGKTILPFEFEVIYDCYEELFGAKKDDKFGFYDLAGKLVIPHQYEEINILVSTPLNPAPLISEPLICVQKDGKWGAIDTRGKTILPFIYNDISFAENNLYCVAFDGKHAHGLVDGAGKEIIPPTYDDILDFSEGLAPVLLDEKFGFIDTAGKLAFPLMPYIYAYPFSEGMAAVYTVDNHIKKMGFIDTSGKLVIPCEYDDNLGFESYKFKNGLAIVAKDDACFLIDKKGKMASKKYSRVAASGEGMFLVKDFNEKVGFLDATGKEVIPCQYDYVGYSFIRYKFHNGLAAVSKDGRWGVIDTRGRVALPLEYDYIISYDDSGVAWCKKDGKYGIIQFNQN